MLIRSKYDGHCRVCGKPYRKHDRVHWTRGIRGAAHESCLPPDPGKGNLPAGKPEMKTPPIERKPKPKTGIDSFTVEWSEVRDRTLAAMNGENFGTKPENSRKVGECTNPDSSWRGYSRDDLDRWLHRGFQLPGLEMDNPPVPIREKRRLRFMEEGDEFHVDLAFSGIDEHFSEWTKKEIIPGLSIEATFDFSSATSHEVLTGYFGFLCRVIYALETSGVDCDVTLVNHVRGLYQGSPNTETKSIIRVKREGEIIDFQSFSPMFSPASLRTFGFLAMVIQAETRDRDVNATLGTPQTENWGVKWNPEREKLEITAKGHGSYEFPNEKMTADLQQALKDIHKGK